MRSAPILLALGTALYWVVLPAAAMGFGKVGSPSLLGQRLDFSALVRLDGNEVLERNCVFAEVRAGENKLGDDQIRVSVQHGADPGERTVRVTTLHALDEPIVTVDVTLGCTSRISRKFVTFLDPPMLNLARAGASDQRAAEPQRIPSQVAPLLAIVEPPRAAARASTSTSASTSLPRRRGTSRAHARAAVHRATRLAAGAQAPARADRRMAARMHAGARSAGVGAPHLQLETARPVVARAPEIAASAAAVAATEVPVAPAAAEPAADALRLALAQERERIQLLEAGLARLRTDTQATRQSLSALQARLQQAEGERYANPLVYLLGGLCALFAAIAVLALRRRPRAGASRWWDLTQMPGADATTADATAAPVAAAVEAPHVETPEDAPWTYQPRRLAPGPAARASGEARMSSIGGLEVTTVIDHALLARMSAGEPAANTPLDLPVARTPHELSIEELIDLEQQVEFFIVLGQDEAAIELLSAPLHGGGAASPLPYFKLLEIHRRRGEEASYARVADAFEQRFGAFAPTWDAALGLGRSLEDYPEALARLQKVWPTPVEAMRVLDAWLFRRQPADDTFDFGACCELLFLYGVARELSEGADAQGIDLLLPIDHPEVDLPLPIAAAPSHFAELYTLPTRPVPLDFDLSDEAPLDGESELRKAI